MDLSASLKQKSTVIKTKMMKRTQAKEKDCSKFLKTTEALLLME